MKLTDLVDALALEVRTGHESLGAEVTGGYASDLLSDVLANSREGDLWVTLQIHHNTVAVASLRELCGIVLVGGREPEEETLARAREEGIPLLVTSLPAFEIVGRLYGLGLRGTPEPGPAGGGSS